MAEIDWRTDNPPMDGTLIYMRVIQPYRFQPYKPNSQQAKLTPEAVLAIRADDHSARRAAEIFDISPSQIKRIRSMQSWSHL